MSAFFLDTELDEPQLREIAEAFKASGYTESELEDILTEIAPLLYTNLCIWINVAGVWAGFDLDWIESQILAGRHRALRRWYNFGNRWICNRVLRGVKEQYWRRVVAHLRAGDAHSRTRG